jgi:hypothetical protein
MVLGNISSHCLPLSRLDPLVYLKWKMYSLDLRLVILMKPTLALEPGYVVDLGRVKEKQKRPKP